jgi:rRNA maturation endonuclease Nob1
MYYVECLGCGARFISVGYGGPCDRCGEAVRELAVPRN